MINYLSKFLTPTVDQVLETFQNTIKELERVADHHSDKMSFHYVESVFHKAQADKAEIEAKRAENIATKFREFLAG